MNEGGRGQVGSEKFLFFIIVKDFVGGVVDGHLVVGGAEDGGGHG